VYPPTGMRHPERIRQGCAKDLNVFMHIPITASDMTALLVRCSHLSSANSFRIRSYAKRARNPFRIRSYELYGGWGTCRLRPLTICSSDTSNQLMSRSTKNLAWFFLIFTAFADAAVPQNKVAQNKV